MASGKQSQALQKMEATYLRVLRVKRQLIHRELPDTKGLLQDSRLYHLFTPFERNEIISQYTPTECAEKMIQALECKGYKSYETFILVLQEFRPSLAQKLTTAGEEVWRMKSNELGDPSNSTCSSSVSSGDTSPMNTPVRHVTEPVIQVMNRVQLDDGEEDAGCFDFNEPGSGPWYHISRMSISCRNLLADELNDRKTFVEFCHAMKVDENLMKVSQRSRNPTGYLLQEMKSHPDATFTRLERALLQINKQHLYESMKKLNDNSLR